MFTLILLLLCQTHLSTSSPIFSLNSRLTSPEWLRINPDMAVWLQRASTQSSPINLIEESISNQLSDQNHLSSKTNEFYSNELNRWKSLSPMLAETSNHECNSVDGRLGICYDANICSTKQGTPLGRCGNNVNKVCCVFEISCGQSVNEKFVYFRQQTTSGGFCSLQVHKHNANVCQMRLQFQKFRLAPPLDGNCSQDLFFITGQNINNRLPKICGWNDGQHYYLQAEESAVINFHMQMQGFYQRTFDIMIQQVECKSNELAPTNCLQYYQNMHGSVSSFNYHYRSSLTSQNLKTSDLLSKLAQYQIDSSLDGKHFEGYPNSLDYVICFQRKSGFCSISYTFDQGLNQFSESQFDVGSADFWTQSKQSISEVSTSSFWTSDDHCNDATDFVAVGTRRLCSRFLVSDAFQGIDNGFNLTSKPISISSNQSVDGFPSPMLDTFSQSTIQSESQLLTTFQSLPDLLKYNRDSRQLWSKLANKPLQNSSQQQDQSQTVLDNSPGPFLIRFVSNDAFNGKGFNFKFKQLPCK